MLIGSYGKKKKNSLCTLLYYIEDISYFVLPCFIVLQEFKGKWDEEEEEDKEDVLYHTRISET